MNEHKLKKIEVMKKNNTIKFQFPGTSESNYQPQTVKVTPRNGKDWTSEDIDSHMKIAGFDWDDDSVSVEPVKTSYNPYDEAVESVRIAFGDVTVWMPVELYILHLVC